MEVMISEHEYNFMAAVAREDLKNSVLCVYHSRDLDGWCSAAIVNKRFADVTLWGWDYGQPIPEIRGWGAVVITDISFPIADMEKISRLNESMVWIDHHVSAIEAYNNCDRSLWGSHKVHLDASQAACELTWEYFFPFQDMPVAVSLLGIWDTHRKTDRNWRRALEFQYGMRALASPDIRLGFPHYLLDANISRHETDVIEESGGLVLKYLRRTYKLQSETAFTTNFQGWRAICLNTGDGPMPFESIYDGEKHDVMLAFRYDGKIGRWRCSLYTEKDDVDCAAMAKRMGGGGHRRAAGMVLDNIDFLLK